jgi:hypothetical protein
MSLDRRRTYLNYLFENMTYLTKLDYGLYTNLELISGREYKSNNILSMYNLSSYNRMMLIFQTENSTSWDSNTTYILVLNRGDSISTSSSYNPFISISGSYSESFIEFKNNELYFRLTGVISSLSLSIRLTGEMFAIGINE